MKKEDENGSAKMIALGGAAALIVGLVIGYMDVPFLLSELSAFVALAGLGMLAISLVMVIIGKTKKTAKKVQKGIQHAEYKATEKKAINENRKRCDAEIEEFLEDCGGEGMLEVVPGEITFIRAYTNEKIPFKAARRGYEPGEEYAWHLAKKLHWVLEREYDSEVTGSTYIHVSDLSDELGVNPEVATFSSKFRRAIIIPPSLKKRLDQEENERSFREAIDRASKTKKV